MKRITKSTIRKARSINDILDPETKKDILDIVASKLNNISELIIVARFKDGEVSSGCSDGLELSRAVLLLEIAKLDLLLVTNGGFNKDEEG